MGQIVTPWKQLYLATTRNYTCVSKTANIIYKQESLANANVKRATAVHV